MSRRSYEFPNCEPPPSVEKCDWDSWSWQVKNALKSPEEFAQYIELTADQQQAFARQAFRVQSTPYYTKLISDFGKGTGLEKILLPHMAELTAPGQKMLDPLGEKMHNPVPRIIHRYTDRLLLLLTDHCHVYCRYCTRKHFTASGAAVVKNKELEQALGYIKNNTQVHEVILSGGDPLTLSSEKLESVFEQLIKIDHIHLIRVATRMPVVNPMRIDSDLLQLFKKYQPIFLMTHFNHPRELSQQSAQALESLVDAGVPVFNQMVLLNGVNNHSSIIKALSYRLLSLRVKPYYMFHCDPSEGTQHFRTSVDNSLQIQREMWGNTSGLAMPNLSLDIPGGGGKVGLTPNFEVSRQGHQRTYVGWDGFKGVYESPDESEMIIPPDIRNYDCP